MLQAYKQTGKLPKKLRDQPKKPLGLDYLWNWHRQLTGSDLLTYQEIVGWSQLTGIKPKPEEVHVLIDLDRIFWRSVKHD